eukprot:scaffold98768_cov17-Tisochrysis_lutea.AAC.1
MDCRGMLETLSNSLTVDAFASPSECDLKGGVPTRWLLPMTAEARWGGVLRGSTLCGNGAQ